MAYISLSTSEALQELQTKTIALCISGLARGKISVDDYLDIMRLVDRTELIATRNFSSFDEFAHYMRFSYPQAAEEQISHEKRHYDHAIKHGLVDTRIGVYEILDDKDLLINGVTIGYVGDNFKGWSAAQILEFEKENYRVGCHDESASESDIFIGGLFVD